MSVLRLWITSIIIKDLCTKQKKKENPTPKPVFPPPQKNCTYCVLTIRHIEQNSPLGYWLPEILNIGKLSVLEKASSNKFTAYKSKRKTLQSQRCSNDIVFSQVGLPFIYFVDNTHSFNRKHTMWVLTVSKQKKASHKHKISTFINALMAAAYFQLIGLKSVHC